MSNVILFIWLNYWGYAQSLTWHGDREDRGKTKCHPLHQHHGGTADSSSWAQNQSLVTDQQCPWGLRCPLIPGTHRTHACTRYGQRSAFTEPHEILGMDVSYHEEPTVNSRYEKDNSSFYSAEGTFCPHHQHLKSFPHTICCWSFVETFRASPKSQCPVKDHFSFSGGSITSFLSDSRFFLLISLTFNICMHGHKSRCNLNLISACHERNLLCIWINLHYLQNPIEWITVMC